MKYIHKEAVFSFPDEWLAMEFNFERDDILGFDEELFFTIKREDGKLIGYIKNEHYPKNLNIYQV